MPFTEILRTFAGPRHRSQLTLPDSLPSPAARLDKASPVFLSCSHADRRSAKAEVVRNRVNRCADGPMLVRPLQPVCQRRATTPAQAAFRHADLRSAIPPSLPGVPGRKKGFRLLLWDGEPMPSKSAHDVGRHIVIVEGDVNERVRV